MKRLFILCSLIGTLVFIPSCETNLEITLEENPYISFHELELGKNMTLEFALVLPEFLEEDRIYPVLLALPPGEQGRYEVEGALDRYWIRESIQRNWIVISPIAPGSERFFEGSETLIPDLLNWVEERYNVEGNKFHVAGSSAGGYSGFRIATMYPERFHSLTVLPGYPVTEDDYNNLVRLQNMPIAMFVGLYDDGFLEPMEQTRDRLIELEVDVIFNIVNIDGHEILSLSSTYWFNLLDGFRPEH